ncbi:MAG: DUF1329 domain-containing protein [Thermodesulfobacteriota bacterium]
MTATLLLAALASASPVTAQQVRPGERFDASSVGRIAQLVSPGVRWCVEHGMPIRITETRSIPLPPAYVEATEKYSAQVRLSPDGRRLESYVAGQPFPGVDASDPQAATKIIDDVDVRNFDADTGSIRDGDSEMSVERHYLLDHLRVMHYIGRLYVEPAPKFEPNREGVRSKTALYPILEPFDMKGIGFLSFRYLDPDKQDDSWLYLPSLRRVRRLSSAQRSNSLFGQDTDADSYYGYAGNPAWMEWKLLGEGEMLGVMHAENFPVKWAPGGGNFAFDDVWELRKVWIIEGRSKFPQYAYSKRVIFVDKETYAILYSDIYDRPGNLWKVWINNFGFRKQAAPGLGMEYPYEVAFGAAIVMADVQMSHATRSALPSPRFPGEQGWYFNQGEKSGTSPDWFTVASMVQAGR